MNFGSKGMTCSEFVDLMRERGYAYDDKNGGFITKRKKKAGKVATNGYRTISLQRDGTIYTFCEHRCVWVWFNGEIPEGMNINHLDFDRSNNRIENLEVVTQQENLQYSKDAGHMNPQRGEKSARSIWTDKEAQAMKFLRKNGWQVKEIAELFGSKYQNVVGRIINGARYGHISDASDIMSVYPAIVMQTRNNSLSEKDQLINAVMGMSGEVGEVADIVKKHMFQEHELDVDHLVEELGDVLYYITLAMIVLDYNMAEIMFNNMDKLNRRYPDGFDAERSVNRERYE